jgi:hypothetical protein
MARNTKKVALLKGRRIRATRLDACGRPVYGDNGQVTSKGFISVGVTANTNATDEVRVTNAAGETIIYEPSVTEFSGYALEIVLGEVDPDLLSLVTGQPVVLDADGNASGFDVDTKIDLTGQGFALEVWAGAPAGDACDDDDAEGTYGYLLFPFLKGGILGDFSIENGGISFTLTGANTTDGNAWGRGPYDVMLNGAAGSRVPGPMLTAISPTTALRVLLVDVAPPAVLIGSRPLLRRTDAPLTSVTATTTAGSKVVTFAVAPDPIDGVGVEYDFGDGSWDYKLDDNGNATHTYEEDGDFVVTATTNGQLVSTTVELPAS